MAAIIHLVRHGHHALLGRTLCGRACDVALDAQGIAEMEEVGRRLAGEPVRHVQASPRRRTQQSAAIITAALGRPVEIETVAAIDEIDLGAWSGRSFAALARDPRWHAWNATRDTARPPGGESMAELTARVIAHLDALARREPAGSIVIVSHAEPIRAALLHVMGIPVRRFAEMAVEPGSIATLVAAGGSLRLERINNRMVA